MIGMPNKSKGCGREVGHNLTSDTDHRDPLSDLHDIETGRFLAAVDALPALVREDLCSNDIRVQLDADGRIIKVVKRRNPEFQQGTELEYEMVGGVRVPTNSDLGLEESSDDVYACADLVYGYTGSSDGEDNDDNLDVVDDGESIMVTEYSAPMDRWDVVFDATSFIPAAHAMQASKQYKQADASERLDMLNALGDELIYSADLFPMARDKRVKGYAKQLLARLQAGKMTKSELGKLTLTGDVRTKKQIALKAQVRKVTGKNKGKLLLQAQAINLSRINAMRNARGFQMQWVEDVGEDMGSWQVVARKGNTVRCTSKLSQGEISMLWDAFRTYEAQSQGSVKLPAWQFKRALTAKLQRLVGKGELTQQEAKVRYTKALVNALKVPEKDAEQQSMVSLSY